MFDQQNIWAMGNALAALFALFCIAVGCANFYVCGLSGHTNRAGDIHLWVGAIATLLGVAILLCGPFGVMP